MSNKEFSDSFDALLNSFGVLPNIILDEYEKSVFLTNAQEDIIRELYTGKNVFGNSFEKTEEVRRYLSELVITYSTTEKVTGQLGVSKNSVFFNTPEDVWFITYESATFQDEKLGCFNGEEALIVPVTQDDFYKVKDNPFKGPSKRRALRLDIKGNIVELVSDYNISRYLVRYIARPKPIILTDLNDLSINGISAETECELNPVIHKDILERAVQLALVSKTQLAGNKQNNNN